MGRFVQLFFIFLVGLFLVGCTTYEKHIYFTASGDESTLEVGDIEVLAEVEDGDENLTNAPDISPELSIPIKGL